MPVTGTYHFESAVEVKREKGDDGMEEILNTAAPLIPTLLKMEFEGGRTEISFKKFHFCNHVFSINDQYSSSFHVIGK